MSLNHPSHIDPRPRPRLRPRWLACAAALAAVLMAPLAAAQVVTLGPGENIQAALNSPVVFEVRLLPGTYLGHYTVPSGKQLFGATGNRDDVIIDNQFAAVRSVLTGLPGAQISSLTVRGGNATGAVPHDRGGGINAPSGGVVIHNVKVENCRARFGGGIYFNGSGRIDGDTEILVCNAQASGGAIYLNNYTGRVHVRCISNLSNEGGAAIRTNGGEPVIVDSIFENNVSAVGAPGGAMDIRSDVIIDRCQFYDNIGGYGGAIRIDGASADREIRNSVFAGNDADFDGGAIHGGRRVDIHNCTFYANGSFSGGVSAVSLDPSTGPMTMRNCIVWGSPDATPVSSGIGCNWSVVDTGVTASAIRTGDPRFVNPAARDFRLLPGSSAIDFGLTALLDFWTVGGQTPQSEFADVRGSIRTWNMPDVADDGSQLIGLQIDCGAYEFYPPLDVDNTCPNDVTMDGVVDFTDLLNVLSTFGTCP